MVLYINDDDDNGTDISSYLATIDDSTSTLKGHFRVTNKSNSDDFAIFTITGSIVDAPNAQGAYYAVPCTHISGATSFSNNEDVLITFARTGDKGSDGAQGHQGYQGNQGYQGKQGATGTGAQGHQGKQGAQGEQGAGGVGTQGSQGKQGHQGDDGDASTVAGPQGAQGVQGAQGSPGSNGNDGVAVLDIATGPPSSPTAGDLWWESDTGHLYAYYNDGNSSQWVAVSQGSAGSPGGLSPFVSDWHIPV